MITDPIADMLTRIKNGYMARKESVEVPFSKMKQSLLSVLKSHDYIGDVRIDGNNLIVNLAYRVGEPAVTEVKRVSKPGLRRYITVHDMKQVKSGLGHIIVSTSQGIMDHREARKKGIGGEIICKIW